MSPQKRQNDLILFLRQTLNITKIQVDTPNTDAKEAEVDQFYEDLQHLIELTPKKRCPFQHRGLKCKIRSQEMPRKTGKFGLEVQNEAGQRLTEFCQQNMLVIANILPNKPRNDSTHGHHQMVNTKVRLIAFFAAEDGEALYETWSWLRLKSWAPYCKIQA